MFGYKILRDIYFDCDDNIKWNVIHQIYPSLEVIGILFIDKIPDIGNGYKFSPSISLNEDTLRDILSFLNNAKNKRIKIYIYSPKNNISSLQSLKDTQSEIYNKANYKLMIYEKYKELNKENIVTVFAIKPL